mmetsp:Transcript_2153/g.5400  ORF Transcript_2153/g.5400 Transcript_2153/m.5400 type:complete len:203 (-) Transcript_2153:1194-1802(-)
MVRPAVASIRRHPVVLRLARVAHEVQRAAHGVAAVVPAVALQRRKQAVADGDGALLRGLAGAPAGGQLGVDEAGADAAACELRLPLREQHGVAADQRLGEPVAAVAVEAAAQAVLAGHPRLDLLPALRRAAEEGLRLRGAAADVHRAAAGADVDDATLALAQQGRERVAHAPGAKQVGVDYLFAGRAGRQADACGHQRWHSS